MASSLYVRIKRDAAQGEQGTFRQVGKGLLALNTGPVAGTVGADLLKHNTEVRGQLLNFLLDLHPRQLELLVGHLLTVIGFEDVAVTKYSGDNGIDVDAVLTVGGVTRPQSASSTAIASWSCWWSTRLGQSGRRFTCSN